MGYKNNKNNENDKIIKYKLKFLYSLRDKKYDKLHIYLKKCSEYCEHKNANYIKNQFGGAFVKIKSIDELNNLLSNIYNLLSTVLGSDMSNQIINKFKLSSNFDKIQYPVDFNFDKILKKIIFSIYTKTDTEFEKKINDVINITVEKINKKDIELKEKEKIKKIKKILETVESTERIDDKEKNKHINIPLHFNPIFISQPTFYPYVNYNVNKVEPNLDIYNSDTSSSDDLEKKQSSKNTNKINELMKKNIIIY